MGSQLPLSRRTELAPTPGLTPQTSPRQLGLVLDDVRIRGMTPLERQAILRALAHLLLEASGVATREASDDHA
jgi:hypothetical protein